MIVTDAIPTIDLAPAREGSASGRAAVAAKIARTLPDSGFIVVTSHGLDGAVLESADRAARDFFALPLPARQALRSDLDGSFRGYIGIGDETVSYTLDAAAPPDLKESFVMGRPGVGGDAYVTEGLGRLAFASNRWPAELSALRPALEACYAAFEELGHDLVRLSALALGLDETWFDDKFDRHASTFRATWYPPQAAIPAVDQLRAGAHTDYTALTILRLEDAPGGLQVETPDGSWTDVPVVPGSLVVNTGDLLSHWTNDQWRSSLHRVVNPPSDTVVDTGRLSLLYFVVPNYDAPIECLPTCTGPDAPPKYAPVTAGEHRRMKIRKSMQVQGTG